MGNKITEDRVYPSSVKLGGEPIARGLSLRDHFAGLAFSALLVRDDHSGPVMTAEYSYQLADAMLKARAK